MENLVNTVNTENSQNNDNNKEITISIIGSKDEKGKRLHNLREKDVDLKHIDMKNHDTLYRLIKDEGPLEDVINNLFKEPFDKYDTPTARKLKKMGLTYYDSLRKDKRNGMKGTNVSRGLAQDLIITMDKMENRPKDVKAYMDFLEKLFRVMEKVFKDNIHFNLAVIHADEFVKVKQPKVKALNDAKSVLTDSLIQEEENKMMYGAVHMHIQCIFIGHAITDAELRKKIKEIKAEMKKEAMDKDGDKFDLKLFNDRFTQYLVKNYHCSLVKGPEAQISITKALYEMGFNLDNNLEQLPPFDQFMNYLRQEFIPDFAESEGYKVDRRLNPNRKHFFKEEYVRSKVNEQTLNNLIQNQKLFIIEKEEIEKRFRDFLINNDELRNKQKEIDTKLPLLEEKEKKVALYDKVIDFAKEAHLQIVDKTNSKFDDIKTYPREKLSKYVGNFCRYFAVKDTIYNRLQKDLEKFDGHDFIQMGRSMLENNCNNIFDYLRRSMNNRIYLYSGVPKKLIDSVREFSHFFNITKYLLKVTSLDPTIDKSKEESNERSSSYSRGGGMGM